MYMRAEMKDIRRHKKYILIKTKEKTRENGSYLG